MCGLSKIQFVTVGWTRTSRPSTGGTSLSETLQRARPKRSNSLPSDDSLAAVGTRSQRGQRKLSSGQNPVSAANRARGHTRSRFRAVQSSVRRPWSHYNGREKFSLAPGFNDIAWFTPKHYAFLSRRVPQEIDRGGVESTTVSPGLFSARLLFTSVLHELREHDRE